MVELTDDALLAILDHIGGRAMLHALLFYPDGFMPLSNLGYTRPSNSKQVALLASSVRKLHITVVNSPGFTSEEFSHLDDMPRYLDGLKVFKFILHPPPRATLTTLIKVPYPFALHNFFWVNRTLDAGEISRYLENQPSIERLHVAHGPSSSINLAPGTLPRLKVLVIPPINGHCHFAREESHLLENQSPFAIPQPTIPGHGIFSRAHRIPKLHYAYNGVYPSWYMLNAQAYTCRFR